MREHPLISGFRDTGVPEDEGQHLQTVFLPAKSHGGPGRFGFVPEAHLTEKSALITPQNRQRLFQEWSKHWDLSKPCLLEKSPPNLIRTRFFQGLFPSSHFIVITRHPVAASLATRKWANSSLELLIEHWVHCHNLFELDRPLLHHVHVLKYEDLIQATETEVHKIYKFLNLSPHPSQPLNPRGNEPYFQQWAQFSSDTTGRALVSEIVSKYENKVRRYGYSVADCGSAIAPVPQSTWKFTSTNQN
ncbi:MAG: sulfotransferase family protein [Candidatus Sulfotelmatobacter sp.]